jgi:hypothetical protein
MALMQAAGKCFCSERGFAAGGVDATVPMSGFLATDGHHGVASWMVVASEDGGGHFDCVQSWHVFDSYQGKNHLSGRGG